MASDKAELQRERILNAAQKCFVEHGFHAASMSSIAATAEMSAGLIYRYFPGKNEIIVAIIRRQLALLRADMCRFDESKDLAAALAEQFGCSGHGINAALFLEMSAEATRDPIVAAALREFDAEVRADLVRLLGEPERALLMQCLFAGLRVREAREPELDRALLKRALERFVTLLKDQPS